MKAILTSISNEIFSTLKKCIGQIFLIHLIYVATGTAIFSPLLGLLTRLMLFLSGKTMLSDLDIAYFAITPIGIISAILFSSILITIVVFEQSSMMAIVTSTIKNRELTLLATVQFTVSRAKHIFTYSIHLVMRVLVIVLPFLASGGLVAWLTITDYDINYYLAEKPPVFLTAAGIIGILLLIMTIALIKKLVDWVLSLPLAVLTNSPPKEVFSKSTAVIEGRRKTLFALFAIWTAIVFIFQFILIGAIQILGSQLIPLGQRSLTLLIILLGILVALYSLGTFFITAFSAGCFSSVLVMFSDRCGINFDQVEFTDRRKERGFKLTTRKVAGTIIATSVIALLTGAYLINSVPTDNDVTIIAHRGAAGKAPENTLASINQAIKDKTDWVEIDVQESVDGEVVVIHDSDLMKLAGNSIKVWEGTLEELQQPDVGSWFDPKFAAERIPTLEAVLETVKGKAKLLIELKYYGHDEMLEQRVVDIVERTGMVDEIALMSLKKGGIEKAHELRSDWSTGLLATKTIGDITSIDMNFLAVNMTTATPGFIKRIHSSGKQVHVWTVNDKMSMARMISLGVDGLITDEPEIAREVLQEFNELNRTERLLLHTAVMFNRPISSKEYRDNSP